MKGADADVWSGQAWLAVPAGTTVTEQDLAPLRERGYSGRVKSVWNPKQEAAASEIPNSQPPTPNE